MPTTLPDTIEISRLTSGTVAGNGTFDVLMRSIKGHLEQEFKNNRIRGPEYSTVYLGAVQSVLQASMSFLLSQEKAALENKLIEAQIEQAKAQTVQVEAQTLLIEQQKANLVAEALNIPKQGLVLDAQKNQITQQTTNLVAEALNIPKQGQLVDAQRGQVIQTTDNLLQTKAQIIAQTSLITQQIANAEVEELVLTAQECKLKAEFDGIEANTLKTAQETILLTQKVVTEQAQTQATGVSADSVIGKQKALYTAQANGFTRDAEQKTAKIMADVWSVQKSTDPDGTPANATNQLNDAAIGRAINKLLTGVGA